MTKKGKENLKIEKRIHPRKTLRTKVVFEDESGEGFIYFYSTDVSMGGLFLESDIPLKIGTHVFLSFSLSEGNAPVRATGKVVRLEREASEVLPVVGMGVQFVELPEAARGEIQRFVES